MAESLRNCDTQVLANWTNFKKGDKLLPVYHYDTERDSVAASVGSEIS